MLQVLRPAQALHAVVPITPALVGRAGDLAEVRRLVQRGGGLVLVVALAAQAAQGGVVQVAVDHVALAGQRVGQYPGAAGLVNVAAVEPRDAAVGAGAALRGDPGEDGGDGRPRLAARGLEVLGHLGGGARGRGLRRGGGELLAFREGGAGGGELAAGAVGLDYLALGEGVEAAADDGGGGAVDGGGESVGGEGQGGWGEDGAVACRVGDEARGRDGDGPAGGEVVHLGNVPASGDGFTACDGLEGRLVEVGSHDAETEAVEGDFVGCGDVSGCP